jgi:succinoglycan biosynthesis protein ExoL
MRNDLVYAFGPDMALLCLIAGCTLGKPVVLEIGDIRELQVADGIKGSIVRALDAYVARASRLLVSTAPGFIDEYYRKWLRVGTRALVLENKMEEVSDTSPSNSTGSDESVGIPLVDRPLRIGYFGSLRDQWAWDVLEMLATTRPTQVEIVVAGFPIIPADLLKRVAKIANMAYLGEYRSPQDLPRLYGSIDMVWAGYPYTEAKRGNVRWARTNRFYESCFYQVPIVLRADCADAVEVERLGIGLVISETRVEAAVERLCAVGPYELASWRRNVLRLPKSTHTYTTETGELGRIIQEIAAGLY